MYTTPSLRSSKQRKKKSVNDEICIMLAQRKVSYEIIWLCFTVDDMRTVSLSMLKTHFTESQSSNRIGRVEFLPIYWYDALRNEAIGMLLHRDWIRRFSSIVMVDGFGVSLLYYQWRGSFQLGLFSLKLGECIWIVHPRFLSRCWLFLKKFTWDCVVKWWLWYILMLPKLA